MRVRHLATLGSLHMIGAIVVAVATYFFVPRQDLALMWSYGAITGAFLGSGVVMHFVELQDRKR